MIIGLIKLFHLQARASPLFYLPPTHPRNTPRASQFPSGRLLRGSQFPFFVLRSVRVILLLSFSLVFLFFACCSNRLKKKSMFYLHRYMFSHDISKKLQEQLIHMVNNTLCIDEMVINGKCLYQVQCKLADSHNQMHSDITIYCLSYNYV